MVTFLRIAFGALALSLVCASRQPVDRGDWPRVVALSVCWMAFPLTLFPIAQPVGGLVGGGDDQRVTPLWAALIAACLLWRRPGPVQVVGLALGFAGVVAISLPNVRGTEASPLGVALILTASISYGVATNLAVPLQQRYGALPVILRSQLVALVLTVPYALVGLPDSEWHQGRSSR